MSLFTVIKLARLKHKLNNLNVMFLAFFLMNYVMVSMQIYSLFNVGFTSFIDDPFDVELYLADCKIYMISWATYTVISIFLHFGMMFCRFIYARYADGLLSKGKNLFHSLVCLVTSTFCLQHILFPLIKNFVNDDDEYPLNIIQGQICTKQNITQFSNAEKNITFIIRPKILMITFSTLIIISALFVNFSANILKFSKHCYSFVLSD